MILKIYDYGNAVKEITVPDKEIREILVHVLSGDETGFVEFTDGEKVYFDASDCRLHGFDDGLYIVHGKAIQKWINFQPSGDRTVSYERMDAFFDNEDEDPVEEPKPPVKKDLGEPMAAEKSFEEKLKKWLESEGIYALGTPVQDMTVPPCGYWEKRWGGGKYIKAGMPDMHIVVNSISIEAELKAPNGRPSELQIQKLNQIDNAGCIGLVLYPKDFEKFQKLIKYIKCNPMEWVNIATYCGLERGWKNE